MKEQHPDLIIVTVEEAKELGLTQTVEIAPPSLIDYQVFKPPLTRTEILVKTIKLFKMGLQTYGDWLSPEEAAEDLGLNQ